jgi:ribosomal protein S27AE
VYFDKKEGQMMSKTKRCPACGGAKIIHYDGDPELPLGECLTCDGTGEVKDTD